MTHGCAPLKICRADYSVKDMHAALHTDCGTNCAALVQYAADQAVSSTGSFSPVCEYWKASSGPHLVFNLSNMLMLFWDVDVIVAVRVTFWSLGRLFFFGAALFLPFSYIILGQFTPLCIFACGLALHFLTTSKGS